MNKRNSGRETMVITIVIVARTILERQIYLYPIVLAIVLPPFSLVQDSMPLKVSSHISSHMVMLLGNFCIILLFASMAQVFMVRNKL